MFSLIITVISIALVAALALATLYYGGTAFGKGAARAEASKIVLQGQQLLGAADLYYTAHRAWPTSIDDLVDQGYLKQIPVAGAPGLSDAVAAGQPWQMVSGRPTFYIATAAAEVCAEVNLSASLRKRGILRQAYTNLVAQCYGAEASELQTVFRKSTDMPFADGTDVATDPNPPTDPTSPEWWVPPGEPPPTTPGGGGGGSTPVSEQAQFALSRTALTIAHISGSAQGAVDAYTTSIVPTRNLSLSIAGSTAFTAGHNCPAEMPQSELCTVTVTYTPVAGQPNTATLTVSGQNAPTSRQVALSISTIPPTVDVTSPVFEPGPPGAIQFEPAYRDFGFVEAFSYNWDQITVRNTGGSPVTLGAWTIPATDGFSIDTWGCDIDATSAYNQVPGQLQPDETCWIDVTFEPGSGGPYQQNISLAYTGGTGGVATMQVGGTVAEPPVVMVYEGEVMNDPVDLSALFWNGGGSAMGGYWVTPLFDGDGKRRWSVTAINRGSVPVVVEDVEGNGDGTIVSTTCSDGMTLGPRSTCVITFELARMQMIGLRPDGWSGQWSGSFEPTLYYHITEDSSLSTRGVFEFEAGPAYGVIDSNSDTYENAVGGRASTTFEIFNWTNKPQTFTTKPVYAPNSPFTYSAPCGHTIGAQSRCTAEIAWVMSGQDMSYYGSSDTTGQFQASLEMAFGGVDIGFDNYPGVDVDISDARNAPPDTGGGSGGGGGGTRQFHSVTGPTYVNLETTFSANAFFTYNGYGQDCAVGQSNASGRNSCNIQAMTNYMRANGHPTASCQIQTNPGPGNMGTTFLAVCVE